MKNSQTGYDNGNETEVLEVRPRMGAADQPAPAQLPKLQANKVGHAKQVDKDTRQGHVYFIMNGATDLIKIGFSRDNINRRCQRLDYALRRGGIATDLYVVGVMPGTKADERRMHIQFADLVTSFYCQGLQHEWFRDDGRIDGFIRTSGSVKPHGYQYAFRTPNACACCGATDPISYKAMEHCTWTRCPKCEALCRSESLALSHCDPDARIARALAKAVRASEVGK